MLRKLPPTASTPAAVRYYADDRLLGLVGQYYEVPPARAQAMLAATLTECLRRWFGPSATPADRLHTLAQDFWLTEPGLLIGLWARFTDPHFDVIARFGESRTGRPGHSITVGDERPRD